MTAGRTALYAKKVPGGVLAIESMDFTTGSRFFVDSTTGSDDVGYGTSPDKPVATIDYAVGLCTDDKGDIIYVMPKHAEDITAATSLVVDVDGIKIKGLGFGAGRPKLTFKTAETATISVTSPNVTIENLQFYANYTGGIAVGITLGALADGFRLINCRAEESANTTEFLIFMSVAAACHDVGIDGLDFRGVTGGSDTQCIFFAGASNFSYVRNFRIYGDFSGAVIDALTAASTYMDIGPGVFSNDDTGAGLGISVKSDTTGMVHDISGYAAKNDCGIAGAAMSYNNCYVANAANANGKMLPGIDT